jgi:hypothetical protein
MIIIGITAAAKIAVNPKILYHAAMVLKVSATSKVKAGRLKILFKKVI